MRAAIGLQAFQLSRFPLVPNLRDHFTALTVLLNAKIFTVGACAYNREQREWLCLAVVLVQ
jgi:hypothetical protein